MGIADETDLVARIQAGDQGAAEEFVDHFRPRLEFIIRSGSKVPAADNPDLIQETLCVGLMQIRAGSFRGDSKIGTWLSSILARKTADYFRKPSTRLETSFDHLEKAAEHLIAPVTRASAEQSLMVRQALSQLPQHLRTVLLLNQYFGLTTADIATRLGKPAGTVGRYLAESKSEMRRVLSSEENESDRRLIRREEP